MNKSHLRARDAHWTATARSAPAEIAVVRSLPRQPRFGGAEAARRRTRRPPTSTRSRALDHHRNNNTVCYGCHAAASTGFPTRVRAHARPATRPTARGRARRPTPSRTTSPPTPAHAHTSADAAVWPGSGYSGGDCKNCHDVHGTANTYDELRPDHRVTPAPVSSSFSLCFDCHDAGRYSDAYNVKRYYPTTAAAPRPRRPARAPATAPRPPGSCRPARRCRATTATTRTDPPAPYGLLVVTMTATRRSPSATAGRDRRSDRARPDAVRKFCFTCHTTSDTARAGPARRWLSRTLPTASPASSASPPRPAVCGCPP